MRYVNSQLDCSWIDDNTAFRSLSFKDTVCFRRVQPVRVSPLYTKTFALLL